MRSHDGDEGYSKDGTHIDSVLHDQSQESSTKSGQTVTIKVQWVNSQSAKQIPQLILT